MKNRITESVAFALLVSVFAPLGVVLSIKEVYDWRRNSIVSRPNPFADKTATVYGPNGKSYHGKDLLFRGGGTWDMPGPHVRFTDTATGKLVVVAGYVVEYDQEVEE